MHRNHQNPIKRYPQMGFSMNLSESPIPQTAFSEAVSVESFHAHGGHCQIKLQSQNSFGRPICPTSMSRHGLVARQRNIVPFGTLMYLVCPCVRYHDSKRILAVINRCYPNKSRTTVFTDAYGIWILILRKSLDLSLRRTYCSFSISSTESPVALEMISTGVSSFFRFNATWISPSFLPSSRLYLTHLIQFLSFSSVMM